MGGEAGGSAEPPAPPRGQRLPRRPPASLGLTCRRSPPRPVLPSRSPALATCPAAAGPGRGSPPAWRVTASHSPPRLARPCPSRGCAETFPEPGAHGASSTHPRPPGHRTCSASSRSLAGRPRPCSRSLSRSRGRLRSPPLTSAMPALRGEAQLLSVHIKRAGRNAVPRECPTRIFSKASLSPST